MRVGNSREESLLEVHERDAFLKAVEYLELEHFSHAQQVENMNIQYYSPNTEIDHVDKRILCLRSLCF